jgi:hypothetical protein
MIVALSQRVPSANRVAAPAKSLRRQGPLPSDRPSFHRSPLCLPIGPPTPLLREASQIEISSGAVRFPHPISSFSFLSPGWTLLTLAVSSDCGLLGVLEKLNSFVIRQFQTLFAKHPGWGVSTSDSPLLSALNPRWSTLHDPFVFIALQNPFPATLFLSGQYKTPGSGGGHQSRAQHDPSPPTAHFFVPNYPSPRPASSYLSALCFAYYPLLTTHSHFPENHWHFSALWL